jgi:hypothetical protein
MNVAHEICRWGWFAGGMMSFVLGMPGILRGDETTGASVPSEPRVSAAQTARIGSVDEQLGSPNEDDGSALQDRGRRWCRYYYHPSFYYYQPVAYYYPVVTYRVVSVPVVVNPVVNVPVAANPAANVPVAAKPNEGQESLSLERESSASGGKRADFAGVVDGMK